MCVLVCKGANIFTESACREVSSQECWKFGKHNRLIRD